MLTQAVEGSRYYWLLPNNKKKPLDNPKVRQAIGLALDRNALVAGAFFGQATPMLGGVVPKWNWGFADIKFFKEGADVEGAKKLLAEAGYPDGFETSMTMASSFPAMMAMAPIIQANLAAVGIKAKIGTMEIPRYWDEVWGPSNFDITTMYWVSPLADPDDFVTNNYKCGMAINVQKSCSPAMDAVLDEAKSRRHAGGAQSGLQENAGAFLAGDGDRSAGQFLYTHRPYEEASGIHAAANGLSEDLEGFLVRKLNKSGRGVNAPPRCVSTLKFRHPMDLPYDPFDSDPPCPVCSNLAGGLSHSLHRDQCRAGFGRAVGAWELMQRHRRSCGLRR